MTVLYEIYHEASFFFFALGVPLSLAWLNSPSCRGWVDSKAKTDLVSASKWFIHNLLPTLDEDHLHEVRQEVIDLAGK